MKLNRREWLKAAIVALVARVSPWGLSRTDGADKAPQADPVDGTVTAVYLTWLGDPTTTMTVIWHTVGKPKPDAPAPTLTWYEDSNATSRLLYPAAPVKQTAFPDSNRYVNRVQLQGLTPDREYLFKVPGETIERRFRTAPADLSKPLTFVVGGDVMKDKGLMEETCRQAAKVDPLFVIIGGDLAYADGLATNVGRWFDFFDAWTKTMVAPATEAGKTGRTIPIITTVGNHEVKGGYSRSPKEAIHYYTAMALPMDTPYRVLDFGKYLSFMLLDSGHTAQIPGAQTDWLAKELAARTGPQLQVNHIFPVYHIPAYPGHGPFLFPQSFAIRQCWSPLFDQAKIDLAFENHDHAFHRSRRIKAGKLDPRGVLYLGDGCWGVPPRDVKTREKDGEFETWYIDQGKPIRHFMAVTLDGKSRKLRVIDATGELVDQIVIGNSAIIDSVEV